MEVLKSLETLLDPAAELNIDNPEMALVKMMEELADNLVAGRHAFCFFIYLPTTKQWVIRTWAPLEQLAQVGSWLLTQVELGSYHGQSN
jgi:hypothetical protein